MRKLTMPDFTMFDFTMLGMLSRAWVLSWPLAFALSVTAMPANAQEQPTFNTKIVSPQAPELLAMLRGGGYVLYFRHGSTPDYAEAAITDDFADCSLQRTLNSVGRSQAFAIGEAFKVLGIPVGDVIASPYCRCMETARIAFGRVQRADEVRSGGDAARLRVRLSTPPPPGTNMMIVGHGSAADLIPDEFIREAEAIIVRPRGEGKFDLIARVRAETWAQFEPRNREPPPGAPRRSP